MEFRENVCVYVIYIHVYMYIYTHGEIERDSEKVRGAVHCARVEGNMDVYAKIE